MNQKFETYLSALRVTEIVRNRVQQVYDFYQETCPEELVDIIITEYITEEGLREYESLWFFSKTYVMEAKNFLSIDEFDLAPWANSVVHWAVKGENYDYKAATPKSRLHLSVHLDTMVFAEFRASQENCDYLMAILREQVIPKLSHE